MRIEVTGKHLELTPAVTEYVEQKATKLPRYYDGVQEIDVILEKPRPEEFDVEVRVEVEKHDTFVARSSGHDVYHCIDAAVDKMSRQLTDFKEKLKNSKR
ncbi:MAG: ribosome-associated translation inhibitor RaiA [Phycisphaerales bacterium]|nr:ribosome-associated translation inhibitor RaiA [Phycisphaerales bacterium]